MVSIFERFAFLKSFFISDFNNLMDVIDALLVQRKAVS